MPTIEQHQDTLELELEAELAKLRSRIALAREQGDWHSYSAFGHRAEGVRDALESVRRVYADRLRAAS